MRADWPQKWQRIGWITGAVFAVLNALVPVALASVSQGFATTTQITPGSLVSLDATAAGTVDPADPSNVNRLFGVVVPTSSASISLSGSNSTGQVQVVTTGTAQVLVSTQSGNIASGDFITASSIRGVGQKATTQTRVIGIAQAAFSATSPNVTMQTLKSSDGSQQQVAVGEIPIVISVASYNGNGSQSYTVPGWLQNLSNNLAGKAVSPIRIVLAVLILISVVITVSVLLYAAVRNAIIAIGRNPLARSSIFRGLLQVGAIVLVLLIAAIAGMYVVITK